jgi:NAD+ synthase (glutamine-hydrolysing)
MFRLAVCTLNQFSLDFEGNLYRIVQSIKEAKTGGAVIRTGPELEIPGYSLDDAFFEEDTCLHSWQVIEKLLTNKDLYDIIIDVGMGVIKEGVLFNCRVLLLNGKIILIRPKTKLAGNGNYREDRWFTSWESDETTWFVLPKHVSQVTGQTFVPFGADVVLEIPPSGGNGDNLRVGIEICEELWRTDSTNIKLFLERGVHLIMNSSASYWEIRKLDTVFTFTTALTLKCGGAYALTNLLGCDGGRLCFYGMSSVAINGRLVTRTTSKEDLFEEVQVSFADISVSDIEAYRRLNYLKVKPYLGVGDKLSFYYKNGYNREVVDIGILHPMKKASIIIKDFEHKSPLPVLSSQLRQRPCCPEEEILWYASLWLWDYLRRTPPLKGFILPLSGGIDSSSVACIVYGMSKFLSDYVDKHTNDGSLSERVKSLVGNASSASEITNKLLQCVYLSTKYSGDKTLNRASLLAILLGAKFKHHNFEAVYESVLKSSPTALTGKSLREQNLQARLRMVHTYFFAEDQLVLAAGNVDEALVGYLTKYDCSSGDLNPIGSISKRDLRSFMSYFERLFFSSGKSIITEIVSAPPSAELTGSEQKDEDDLQLTYDEMSLFGRYRKGVGSYGPVTMFKKLWEQRHDREFDSLDILKDPDTLAKKIKRFFTLHAKNRHKQTILTPSLHSESYSPDDNRYDHRQIIFDSNWSWQFKEIDGMVRDIKNQI